MQQDDNNDDISAVQVKHLLLELTALAGQEGSENPVLELQIGEIITRASVEYSGADRYLSITGLLPSCEHPHYLPLLFSPKTEIDDNISDIEFFWQADEGRYIVVKKIPMTELSDERSVMDAILSTADLASRYFAVIQSDKKENMAR